MRNSKIFQASIIAANFVFSCLPAMSSKAEGDLFPLKANNSWTYRSVDENGKASEIKCVVESARPGKDGVMTYKVTFGNRKEKKAKFYSKDGCKTVLKRIELPGQPLASIDFVPAKLIIESKLRPGSVWQWTGARTRPAGETERWQVFPTEKVIVPAGKFDCVKVGGLTIRGNVMVYQTRWYAENVGMVKSVDVIGSKKSTQELAKYRLN